MHLLGTEKSSVNMTQGPNVCIGNAKPSIYKTFKVLGKINGVNKSSHYFAVLLKRLCTLAIDKCFKFA